MKKPLLKNGKLDNSVLLERIKEINPYSNALYSRLDDISVARLFSDVFKEIARFNTTAKEWYYYDGIVWKVDTGSMHVENYAKALSRALLIYSADIDSSDYKRYIARLGDRKKRVVMITDARDFNFVETSDFDTNSDYFNCKNCVIDLTTLEVLEHNPDFLLSKVSNVYYDKNATSKDFEKFFSEIMKNDIEKMHYLQKVFGYALTGANTHEECYMLYGKSTRNGKSTLLDTISYLFGDYSKNTQPETFAQQKERSSRTASGDIARLDGCRFLHMSEPPKRMKFDVALLKTMLGRDVITARNLCEREFQFIPVFKLFINTNYLPLVTDDTLFSSGRVKVITFERHFEEWEQDIKLSDKLKKKENISGIFNWLLCGLRSYLDDNEELFPPESVRRATSEYRTKSDKIQNFINDCFVPDVIENTACKDAFEVYTRWCRDNNYGVENKSNFIDELRSKGLVSDTGTVKGMTIHNVIKGYRINRMLL